MTPFMTLLLLGALAGFVLSSFLFGGIWMVRLLLRKLKPWVLLLDEEGGVGFHGRVKLKDGHILMGKEEDAKRYPVTANGRSLTNDGTVYILGRQTGANFRAPSRAEIKERIQDPGEAIAFDITDPGLLARTWVRRVAQETVDGQLEKDPAWKGVVIPVLIFAGGVVLALVIGMVKVSG